MKLAFSTLGCPDWKFSEIYATAKDLGLAGVEIRGIANEMSAPRIKAFSPEQLPKTLEKLEEKNLEIPMLTSGAVLGDPDRAEAYVAEAKEYLDLAEKLGTPYVRVLISPDTFPKESDDLECCKKAYGELCDYAAGKAVTPLIETNAALADTAVLREFLQDVGRENMGVLWDIHHPFRYFGEEPRVTYDNIGRYVKYIHVKDSVMHEGKVEYRMMGYGDIPIFDSMKVLHDGGYDGYISLEWVKRWCPDLQEPGIVFSHFTSYMNYLLNQL